MTNLYSVGCKCPEMSAARSLGLDNTLAIHITVGLTVGLTVGCLLGHLINYARVKWKGRNVQQLNEEGQNLAKEGKGLPIRRFEMVPAIEPWSLVTRSVSVVSQPVAVISKAISAIIPRISSVTTSLIASSKTKKTDKTDCLLVKNFRKSEDGTLQIGESQLRTEKPSCEILKGAMSDRGSSLSKQLDVVFSPKRSSDKSFSGHSYVEN